MAEQQEQQEQQEQHEQQESANEGNQEKSQEQSGTQEGTTSDQQEDADKGPETSKDEQSLGITKPESKESEETVSAGQQIDDLVDQLSKGELSKEQRDEAEKLGLLPHLEALVAGKKMIQERTDAEIVSVVGSKEAYGELQEWAAANLDDAEIEAFNDAVVKSGNMGIAKLAVEGLNARYAKANGKDPNTVIQGGGTVNANTRQFESVDEYISETMSLKYKQDPEYAAKVEARRNISGF